MNCCPICCGCCIELVLGMTVPAETDGAAEHIELTALSLDETIAGKQKSAHYMSPKKAMSTHFLSLWTDHYTV